MKKLSKAQQEVLDKANETIRKAKTYDYPEWLMMTDSYFDWRPETLAHWRDQEAARISLERTKKEWERAVTENKYKKYWEMGRNNITLTHCSGATLKALEKAGEIEIIKDSTGSRGCGIDYVKILNPKF